MDGPSDSTRPAVFPLVGSLVLRRVRAVAALLLLFAIVDLTTATSAVAHPLGNFTTNRYARVEAGAQSIRIHYVLDEAELVAFRERAELAKGVDEFADARAAAIASGLRLRVDGRPVGLRVVDRRLTQPEGQGGLTTLRLEILFEAPLPSDAAAPVDVEFEDGNQPDRLGWREIVAHPVGDTRMLSSDVPARDETNALREYSTESSAPPLDVRRATFAFAPGSGTDPPARLGEISRRAVPGGDRFVGLVTSTTSSPVAVVAALALALAFGGLHALGPGHGKTVMAAYLVSTRGRRRDALYLGGLVSLMHTASVLTLALVLATFGRNVDADRLYPALTVFAGVVVTAVGVRLLVRRWRARPAIGHDHPHPHGHDHEHPHDDHDHGHEHGGRRHSHALPADVAPLSRAGLVALGTSGGLFPSPSAVVVLVGAFAVGRAPLGLALIAAFSVGLAVVLVAVGLLLVAGRDRLAGSSFAVRLRWLPLFGAAAIVVLGFVLVVQGVVQLR